MALTCLTTVPASKHQAENSLPDRPMYVLFSVMPSSFFTKHSPDLQIMRFFPLHASVRLQKDRASSLVVGLATVCLKAARANLAFLASRTEIQSRSVTIISLVKTFWGGQSLLYQTIRMCIPDLSWNALTKILKCPYKDKTLASCLEDPSCDDKFMRPWPRQRKMFSRLGRVRKPACIQSLNIQAVLLAIK